MGKMRMVAGGCTENGNGQGIRSGDLLIAVTCGNSERMETSTRKLGVMDLLNAQ